MSPDGIMAIHKIVLYSPDRRIRITANPGGTVFRVERDLVLVKDNVSSLAELASILAEFDLTFEDLIPD